MAGLFLLAYFFYIDGVHTIIRMAVDYGLALGFPSDSLIVALLITQFVGFPAALAYGLAARRVGPKPTLYFGVVVYVAVTVYAYFMTSVTEFYVLAVVVGLVQGGVQAISRSLYARFVPAAQSGEFFGFFNMLGRFAAIVGPSLVAVTGPPHRQLPARDPVRDRRARDRGGAPRLRPGGGGRSGRGLRPRRPGDPPRAEAGTARAGRAGPFALQPVPGSVKAPGSARR